MKYWLFQNNQVTGPFEPDQLAQNKSFGADTLVCPEGRKGTEMGDWKRASTVADLAAVLQRGPSVATSAPPPAAASLPPEPTLQDLTRVGNLQEKLSVLENAIGQLKTDLSRKENDIAALQAKNTDLESRLGSFSTVQGELQGARQQIQELQDRLQRTREELRQEISKTGEEGRNAVSKVSDLEKRLQDTQKKPPPPWAVGLTETPAQPGAGAKSPFSISVPPPAPMSTLPPAGVEHGFPQPVSAPGPSASSSKLVDLQSADSKRPVGGIVDDGKPRKKRGGLLIVVLVLAAGATAGLLYLSGISRKPIGVPRPNSQEPPKTVPAASTGSGGDYSRVAEDFVKQYRIPNIGVTLEQRLEGAFPPSGNLSPWFPQKVDDGKYQVNFYVRGTPLVYQFLVEPHESRVSGINPPAVAVLNGATPRLPTVKKRVRPAPKPKAKLKPKRVARGRGRPMQSSDSGAAPSGSNAAPAETTPIETAPSSAEPAPADNTPTMSEESSAPNPPPQQPAQNTQSGSGEDNSNLSNMLLPGVPRRSQ